MSLLPKNEHFYDLLEQLSGRVVAAADQFVLLSEKPSEHAPVERIHLETRTASDLTMNELSSLDSAFITPLDREDLMRLMGSLNAVVESIDDTASLHTLYNINASDPSISESAQALQSLAKSVQNLIVPLRDGHKLETLAPQLRRVHEERGKATEIARNGIAALRNGDDGNDNRKRVDVVQGIRQTVDRCETVRNTVLEVILKNS